MKFTCLSVGGLMLVISCFVGPSATINDQYIEVTNPGQDFGLVEVDPIEFDKTFGYPSKETPIVSYSLVNRNSGAKVEDNASIKIYFSRKHRRYQWKVREKPELSDYYLSDTIKLKTDTWYRLTTAKYGFEIYYFQSKDSKTYQVKLKPKPGAW
jgi:hypothetical protein